MKNVNRHISDKPVPHDDGSGNVDYWQADILSAYDYSPFGVMLSGRTFEKEETVEVCHNETTLTTTPVLEEGFGSWGSWNAINSALLTYVNSEMQVSNPSNSSNNIGASKTFVTGSGVHSVSFDIIDNTCATVVLWPPSVTPKTINVYIRDNTNNVVASGAYTTAGNYSLSFTPATTGATYKIEFYMASASAFCYYRIDDVLITYQSEQITQVCENVSKKGKYRYGWQNHERVDEISGSGNHYTAEHWEVDTRTGRRWNIDPVIKPWQSGYSILSNNPIVMVDPDGAADFYNQSGKKVGTDGVDDGKLYVLTTQADVKKARQSYYGKGMKGFFNIILGKGGQGTIQTSDFTGDVVGLPSANVRKEIGKSVDRSNSPTTDDKEGGFHEEGGIWGTDATGTEQVVHSKPGAYANPKTDNQATVNVFDAANSSEKGLITNVQGTFHIHPSGTIVESSTSSSPGTTVSGGTTTTYSFEQTPSNVDVNLATQGGNTSGYNIVVGARNNTVYIHGTSSQNKAGTNYRATFPLDKFKSIGN